MSNKRRNLKRKQRIVINAYYAYGLKYFFIAFFKALISLPLWVYRIHRGIVFDDFGDSI